MRLSAGLPGTQFAPLSSFGATSGATNCQCCFLLGFHGYRMHRSVATRCSIVITDCVGRTLLSAARSTLIFSGHRLQVCSWSTNDSRYARSQSKVKSGGPEYPPQHNLVNFDQSESCLWCILTTEANFQPEPQLPVAHSKGPRSCSHQLGPNVAADLRVSRKEVESRPIAHPGARWRVRGSPKIAAEAIAAESSRGDRELPSATLWNCYLHHRLV
jgi:hypothetical protein